MTQLSVRRENPCRGCGKTIQIGRTNCAEFAVGGATERLVWGYNASRISKSTRKFPTKEGNPHEIEISILDGRFGFLSDTACVTHNPVRGYRDGLRIRD